MQQVYLEIYSKAPERRRRSFLGRLWHHRARLAFTVIAVNAVLGLAAYSALRATGRLPSQVQARRENEMFERWLHGAIFERTVAAPLEKYLADNAVAPAEVEPLVRAIRFFSRFDMPTPAVFVPPKELRSPVIQHWRTILAQLDDRGVRVYGSIPQLQEGELWLRRFIQERAPARFGGDVDLRALLQRRGNADVAIAEAATRLGATREELDGIVFVASRAEAMREGERR